MMVRRVALGLVVLAGAALLLTGAALHSVPMALMVGGALLLMAMWDMGR